MADLLCKRCDVFVGFAATGIVREPGGRSMDWKRDHCWMCGRSRAEVEADPRGRKRGVGEVAGGAEGAEFPIVDSKAPDASDPSWSAMSTDGPMDTPIDEYVKSYDGSLQRGGLTKDVAFNRKSFSEDQPENPDQSKIHVGTDDLRVELVQDYSDEDLRRVCTYAINATRGIDPENPPNLVDWEEMLQGGLQTALEDFRVSFAIYGMSRTGTHQVVRTRAAAFHQQSQRAHYYGDRPSVRMPESFVGVETDDPDGLYPDSLDVGLEYERLAEHAAWFYRLATHADISYQDARFGLLEGTANFILWEGSLREFMNVYAYRAQEMFQWEISYVFHQMRERLVDRHPYLDKYVKISCETTQGAVDEHLFTDEQKAEMHPDAFKHVCRFQGWECIENQCSKAWARETNRSFKSKHHSIEKKV